MGQTTDSDVMTAYAVVNNPPLLQKASIHREWMSSATDQFPYRCLPLAMGNQLGWDIINPKTFYVTWTGESSKNAVKIETPDNQPHPLALSHFGVATFTFSLGYLFRTPPGVGLLLTGPTNQPLDGLTPCTGYVETEWLPATATMNWLCTRPGLRCCFPAGVPCCRIIPYPRQFIEQFKPEVVDLTQNTELQQQYEVWSRRRDQFNKDLNVPGSEAAKNKWQKDYFQGGGDLASTGQWPDCSEIHQTKFSHRSFQIKRSESLFCAPNLQRDVRPIRIGSQTVVMVQAELSNQ